MCTSRLLAPERKENTREMMLCDDMLLISSPLRRRTDDSSTRTHVTRNILFSVRTHTPRVFYEWCWLRYAVWYASVACGGVMGQHKTISYNNYRGGENARCETYHTSSTYMLGLVRTQALIIEHHIHIHWASRMRRKAVRVFEGFFCHYTHTRNVWV